MFDNFSKITLTQHSLEQLKEDYFFADMHVHSKHSHDSNNDIRKIIVKAKELGIKVAITDHSKYKGAMEAAKISKNTIIPGIELLSKENKELLVYFYSSKELEEFYKKNIEKNMIVPDKSNFLRKRFFSNKINKSMEELIDSLKDYSCIKSIPHPFTYPPRNTHSFFRDKKNLLKKIEAIEILNCTTLPMLNRKADIWAINEKKAFTAGSDSHTLDTIGNAATGCKADSIEEFLDQIRKNKSIVIGKEMKLKEAVSKIIQINNIKKSKCENEKEN